MARQSSRREQVVSVYSLTCDGTASWKTRKEYRTRILGDSLQSQLLRTICSARKIKSTGLQFFVLWKKISKTLLFNIVRIPLLRETFDSLIVVSFRYTIFITNFWKINYYSNLKIRLYRFPFANLSRSVTPWTRSFPCWDVEKKKNSSPAGWRKREERKKTATHRYAKVDALLRGGLVVTHSLPEKVSPASGSHVDAAGARVRRRHRSPKGSAHRPFYCPNRIRHSAIPAIRKNSASSMQNDE